MSSLAKLSFTVLFLTAVTMGARAADDSSDTIVKDSDEAIRIAMKACGHSLNIPASDHPRWEAELAGDHWEVWMLSDLAPKRKCALQDITVPRIGGRVPYCTVIVGVGCSGD